MNSASDEYVHRISVVIPVYQGENTLPALTAELSRLTERFTTAGGRVARVEEVILAYDRGPDGSGRIIRELGEAQQWIRPVWLSRNYGQHAATLAGIASSGGDWVVTLDEDGQHDPADIPGLLDAALDEQADLVYAAPVNRPPHSLLRNTTSRVSKSMLETVFGGGNASRFHSYRLILGEIARSVAAYAGTGVYLDVALGWVTSRIATAPVRLREEGGGRVSGYSYRRLFAHFWSMILTSGTRGLRLVTGAGAVFFAGGILFALYLVVMRLAAGDIPEGWTSQMVLTAVGFGVVLMALGVIAEYLGLAVGAAQGKPAYLIVRDPHSGPLGHTARAERDNRG